jgi:hypothetical protein
MEHFICVSREVMQTQLQDRCFDQKISNSHGCMYKTYIREVNDVVKMSTRQMSPRKTQKLSGGGRMFRSASVLEPEVTESDEF